MARGVLCPKCATVAPATAASCPKCGTVLGAGGVEDSTALSKKPKERPLNHGSAMTLDDEAPKSSTQPHKPFSPDATFTDHDHEGATIDVDSHELNEAQRQKLQPPAPTLAKEPPGKTGSTPRRTVNSNPAARALGPIPAANAPVPRRSGALANHQAAVAAAAAAPPPARKDPMTGEKLGAYIVEEKIGTGGMGVVYKARQPQIGSTVAIKILRGDVIADKRDMERLLDEARVVNAIKHRGIINIFGAGELSDGRQYLVMEYLDGETLEKRLERVGKLSAAEAIPILDEVLAALAAAHSTGIVHRDLKPANIFLVKQSDGPDLIKLLDFGLARRQMQEVSRIAGTPDYISPEHARGRPAGPPADLYGFGILAFHLLTGQLPFKGNTPMEMMEQHVHSPPPVPAEVNPSIPPAMSGLILALLAKDPAKRPDADRAKLDLKAAGRQLQAQLELAESPDGATPKEGRPAMTALNSAELDPRLKALARKADLAKFLRTLARNWPWVLAGIGLLWILGVVIWMLATPAVPVPHAPIPIPIKKAPPPAAPVKVEPPPAEPARAEPAPEPTPAPTPEPTAEPTPAPAEPVTEKTEDPVEVKAFEDPAAAAPPRRDPAKVAALKEEKALDRWRLEMRNQISFQDSRLTGDLDQFRPAMNAINADVANVTNAQGQQSLEGRLKDLKAKIEQAIDRQ